MFGKLFTIAAVGAAAVLGAPAPTVPQASKQVYRMRTAIPSAIRAPSPNLAIGNSLPLYRVEGGMHSANKLNSLHRAALAATGRLPAKGYSPIISVGGGQDYVTPVQFGTETFNLLVDTGSSDSWAPVSNFTCVDLMTYAPSDQSVCAFGPTWDIERSPTAKVVAGQRLDVQYGDSTFARGTIVTETVTVGQIQVVGQEVGAVNFTGWKGNQGDSGMLGLAFEALDNAYPAGSPTLDAYRIRYNPIFQSMYRSGQVNPVFTIKIARNATGSLTLGGVPADVAPTGPWAVAPFQYTVIEGVSNSTFSFYTVNMTATWGASSSAGAGTNATNATGPANPPPPPLNGPTPKSNTTTGQLFPGIVDSGTTGMYLPTADAEAFNALWSPPAKADFTGTVWTVDCNAVPGTLAFTVAGVSFKISPADLLYYDQEGNCASTVFGTGAGLPKIIGDAFLRNVIVVHDVGASQMRIASTE